MSEDLMAWIRAQLDDDERVALAVRDHRRRRGELHWQLADPESQPGLICDQVGNVVTLGGPGATSRWHADHIARHDPARVLAEVAAKRRVLDDLTTRRLDDTEPDGGWAAADAETDGMASSVVRLLAQPYADRPGYRTEWRP